MRAIALRYALAPACILLAVLLYFSPVARLFPPAGLFVLSIIGVAWFGGAGPGFLTAVLGAIALPHIVPVSYPLVGGYLDLPRFIAFSIIGLAVGWGSSRRAGKLREQERYARAMEVSDDGFWDWFPATDSIYTSRRLLEIYGFTPGTTFNGHDDLLRSIPFHPEDRPLLMQILAEHHAGRTARHDVEIRFIRDGETRWAHLAGTAERGPAGAVIRWTGTVRDITERKQAEEALRESEERFALAVAGSYDSIWFFDFVARTVFFSARTRELCGLPPGPEVVPLDGWFEALPVHPEDRPRRAAAMEAHLSGKAPVYEGEFRVLQPDGVYRWRHVHGKCVRDADGKPLRMAGSISDVDARRRTEDALRDSEQRYELAMAASESGYWDWDATTDRFVISARANELVGFPAEITFTNRADFRAHVPVHPEDWQKWETARKELFAGRGERLAMELRYIVRGETRWHALQAICKRDDTGKVVRWTGSSTDVTERKRAEEALRESERKLRQAQRLEAMGTLAGGIAHDFNNILGAILGYGEMALRGAAEGSRLRRDLDSILVAGERGRALIDRVLAFSRSSVGERVVVHVEKEVREALDLIEAQLPEGVRVEASLKAGGAAIVGESTQVHQVVMNMGTNAVQAMQAGGTLVVSLEVMRCDVTRIATIGRLDPGEYLSLTVADDGGGIPPEIIDRIFDPFFTTKEVGVGTGLGLSLVHGIVIDLGGAMDVSSKPGAGSTFTVFLPRVGDAAEAAVPHAPALPGGNGECVLVVDDEELLVGLAIRTLEEIGYVPAGFTSSAAALAAFRADPARFDVIITDERMPGISGSALIREVRGIRREMPILLMSGYLGGGLAERALEAGADDVLKKPLSAHDLAMGLARVLRK